MSSTQERLLEATRRLVSARGAAVSMADIAREAGVSRQAVYLHFGTRAGLFVAVVRHMDATAGIRRRFQQALALDDPVEALRTFLDVWLRYVDRIRPMAAALLASRQEDPDAAAAWNDRMRELRSGFRAGAQRLADAGRLRPGLDAPAAADLACAMTSVPVWEHLTVDCGRRAGEARRLLVDAVTAAIAGGQSNTSAAPV